MRTFAGLIRAYVVSLFLLYAGGIGPSDAQTSQPVAHISHSTLPTLRPASPTSQPVSPTSQPSPNGQATSKTGPDTGFLQQYSKTGRFHWGQPQKMQITPDGKTVLFLRGEPYSPVLNLYAYDLQTRQERVLLTADRKSVV